jgi:hypothetical protein
MSNVSQPCQMHLASHAYVPIVSTSMCPFCNTKKNTETKLVSWTAIFTKNDDVRLGIINRISSTHIKAWDVSSSQRSLWRIIFSGMWRRVVCMKFTDLSEERTAFIFKFDESINKATSSAESFSCFLLVACLAYSSILRMEAVHSFETSVNFYRNTRRHIPEDCTRHSHRCENLRSNIKHFYSVEFSRVNYFGF